MSAQHFLLGDTREVIATIPDGSVDLVVTSPPFLALRSYLPADHPDKGLEIGSEATPAEFIDVLLGLAAEWRRVLAPHGSIAIELGDTYSGSGGAGGDYGPVGLRAGQPGFDGSSRRTRLVGSREHRIERHGTGADGGARVVPVNGGHGWPLAKSLTLIPELFRIGLVYGINPLTGAPSPAGRWRARNVVRWVRPNPPVGALGDKFRPATSEIVVACVSDKRWFDGDAVRVPSLHPSQTATSAFDENGDRRRKLGPYEGGTTRPLYDWWEIPPGGYGGAHYAVWPPELVVPLIESMCPREVCTACGTPRRRIVETTAGRGGSHPGANGGSSTALGRLERIDASKSQMGTRCATTIGWTACDCAAPFRPGIVLDPFGGSGTTLAVASGHGRTGIGIDLDERNLDLARERVGMFLTTDHPFAASAAA